MDFLKKSSSYTVQHTKAQAVLALLTDSRVNKVITKRNEMVIKTEPLMSDGSFYPELSLKPTGKYVITMTYHKQYARLRVKISRKNGGISNLIGNNHHHPHVDRENQYGGICFGSAASEVSTIRMNKDWYWLGVMSLNLLQDFTDHNVPTLSSIEFLVRGQIKYARNKKFTKLITKKTSEIIKKDQRLISEYSELARDGDSFFINLGGQLSK